MPPTLRPGASRLWQAFDRPPGVGGGVGGLADCLAGNGISRSQLQLFVSAGYLALTLVSRSVIAPRVHWANRSIAPGPRWSAWIF